MKNNTTINKFDFMSDTEFKNNSYRIKAGIKTKAKSLKVYDSLYAPEKTLLFSDKPMNKNSLMYPLYVVHKLKEICEL